MNLIEKAIEFANRAHSGQVRKYSNLPYILHPLEVMNRVAHETDSPVVIAAAALHDIIEDCGEFEGEFYLNFPVEVRDIVIELTNASYESKLPREERKCIDRKKLCGASREAKFIKIIDRYCNVRDFLDDRDKVSEKFIKIYLGETTLLLNECLTGVHTEYFYKIEDMINWANKAL